MTADTTTPPFGTWVPGNAWDAVAGLEAEPRTVSVIVAHYEQQAELDRTLSALARQTHPADLLEIVVVDDGSRDEPRVPPGVRLVRQEDRGFRAAAARNLGVRASSGDILCLLDADTAPEPAYVARMVRLPSLVPEAVTVGRRRHAALAGLPIDVPVEDAGPRHELPEPQWLRAEHARSHDLLDADDRSYRFVIGAVVACSRWLFDEVGGFDETFDAYGGEDWEWAHRAWIGGAVLAHVPDAVAWHDGPEWAGRSADAPARLARKNGETMLLTGRIPVAGSRPLALLAVVDAPDVAVVLRTAQSPAAAWLCVDSLLAALPHARVVVPDAVRDALGPDPRVLVASAASEIVDGARAVVELARPVRVAPLAAGASEARDLAWAIDHVGVGTLGTVRLGDAVTVRSRRAALRRQRWGSDAGWQALDLPPTGCVPIDGEPDLEAYLGGWG